MAATCALSRGRELDVVGVTVVVGALLLNGLIGLVNVRLRGGSYCVEVALVDPQGLADFLPAAINQRLVYTGQRDSSVFNQLAKAYLWYLSA